MATKLMSPASGPFAFWFLSEEWKKKKKTHKILDLRLAAPGGPGSDHVIIPKPSKLCVAVGGCGEW